MKERDVYIRVSCDEWDAEHAGGARHKATVDAFPDCIGYGSTRIAAEFDALLAARAHIARMLADLDTRLIRVGSTLETAIRREHERRETGNKAAA